MGRFSQTQAGRLASLANPLGRPPVQSTSFGPEHRGVCQRVEVVGLLAMGFKDLMVVASGPPTELGARR
jgi:hypothetical protein